MKSEVQKQFLPLQVTLKNGATATLRPLMLNDGEAMAEFYTTIPRHNIRFYSPYTLDREHALANAAKADSEEEVVLLLEDINKQIVGYAWYRWEEAQSPNSLFGICIRPDYQEQGAGTLLMKRLLEIAKSVGPPVMTLTVQLANVRAVALYTKMGFTIVREQMCHRDSAMEFEDEAEYYMEQRVQEK